MQIKIITVPSFGGDEQGELLNKFLRGNKIISIDKNFYSDQSGSFWSFCITYIPQALNAPMPTDQKREKVDYKAVLPEDVFAKFSSLRIIRKKLAEADAVPAYAVFTDAELAEIAKLDEITPANLLKIEGIGEKRVEKYGKKLCAEPVL